MNSISHNFHNHFIYNVIYFTHKIHSRKILRKKKSNHYTWNNTDQNTHIPRFSLIVSVTRWRLQMSRDSRATCIHQRLYKYKRVLSYTVCVACLLSTGFQERLPIVVPWRRYRIRDCLFYLAVPAKNCGTRIKRLPFNFRARLCCKRTNGGRYRLPPLRSAKTDKGTCGSAFRTRPINAWSRATRAPLQPPVIWEIYMLAHSSTGYHFRGK